MTINCEISEMEDWLKLAFGKLNEINNVLDHLADGEQVRHGFDNIQYLEGISDRIKDVGIISKIDYDNFLQILKKCYESSEIKLSENEIIQVKSILSKYFAYLTSQMNVIEESFSEGFRYIPKDDLKEIKKISNSLSLSLRKSIKNRLNRTQKLVYDFIINLERGESITGISRALSKKYDSGFSIMNTWFIVESLEQNGLIHTIGGRKDRARERFCFPNLLRIDRSLQDGKEEIIWGSATKDISKILDTRWTRYFGINLFEFNSNYDPQVYVICKDRIPLNEEVRTVGIFHNGRLEEHLEKSFGLKLKDSGHRYTNEDSLIAYAWWDKKSTLKWIDKHIPEAIRFEFGRG